MKRAALFNLFIVAVALSLSGVGCKRGPKALTPIPGQGATVGNPSDIGPTTPIDQSPISSEGIKPADRALAEWLIANGVQDRSQFAAQTVHFDLDSSVVKPGDVGKIQTVGSYLSANLDQAIIIEGHCDERGTEEYNRALGERRAMAVREVLVRAGVDAGRIHTISFGEDVPAIDGHNEAAWSKNRRGEFVLLKPKN